MNPDATSSPPPPPTPASPVPWRIVGLALAAVGGIVGAGLWWNHHQDKQNAQKSAQAGPSLPPPSVMPPEAGTPKESPAPAPAATFPAPALSGPLTPLTPATPSEAPSAPPASSSSPVSAGAISDPGAVPNPAANPSSNPPPNADADRQVRLEKYTQLRDQMRAEKEAAQASGSPGTSMPGALPPPAAFPETVIPAQIPPEHPAPLPPTAAGEIKFVPGPLQAARDGVTATFSLPGIGAPATPAPAADEDGGVSGGAADLKTVDFGAVAGDGAPRVPPPALPFVLLSRVVPSPWDAGSELVFVGLQPVAPAQVARPRANLVLLVDDSISMGDPDKLPFLRQAVDKFLDRLEPDDRIALVVYAGDSALLLPSTSVQGNKDAIRAAFAPGRLMALSSDRPGASLQIAYDIARKYFVKDGINRVIAVTDGDLNLGVGEAGGLYDYVSRNAREGITLSLIGLGGDFAIGPKVRQLLRAGHGRVAAAKSIGAVGLALDNEVASPLPEAVRDLRFALPVGPDRAAAWRLVGYQNRLSAPQGAGFLAVYEVRKKEGAVSPGPHEMNLRFRRESTAADEILAQSLDSGPPPGLDPRVFRDFSIAVGEVRKRVESLSPEPKAGDGTDTP